jgi:hypothetical protein
MANIQINDEDGKPVRYAHLEDGKLILQFEYYGRFEGEGDYEVIQSVEPSEFETIARKFGIESSLDILSIMKQISDAGKGQKLVDALNQNKIKHTLFTWLS